MKTLLLLSSICALSFACGQAVDDTARGSSGRALTAGAGIDTSADAGAKPVAPTTAETSPEPTEEPAVQPALVPATTPADGNPSAEHADAGPALASADAGLPPGVVLVAGHRVDVGLLATVGDVDVGRDCSSDADCALGWCGPAIRIVPLICEPVNADGHLRLHSACNADDECSQDGGGAVCRAADYPHCPHTIAPHTQCCRPGADGSACDAADPVDSDPCRFDPMPASGS